MKKILLLLYSLILVCTIKAQNYNNIVSYYFNNTPVHGVKIKTNLPFTSGSQMPTIHIYGYRYRPSDVIDLSVVSYIYGGAFINYSARSAGDYTPPLSLSNENGKVVLFINDKLYFPRFSVSAYGKGMSADTAGNYQNWTVVDDTLSGTNTVSVPYKNKFSGDIYLTNGIWNNTGKVGIGTTNPTEMLSVKGNIKAQEVKVTTAAADWPDYVFKPGYKLLPLDALAARIKNEGRLPDMPLAGEVEKNGLDLGKINKLQQQKIEELTLYMLQQHQQNKVLQEQVRQQAVQIERQEKEIEMIKTKLKIKQ